MKKRKLLSMIGVVMILVLMAGACSKKDASISYDSSTAAPNESSKPEMDMNYGEAEETKAAEGKSDSGNNSGKGLSSTSAVNTGTSGEVQTQDKIIRTFYMDVETQEFDSLMTQISSEINRLNGYVENSKVSGKRYYGNGEARYGSIVARIPSEKVDEFLNTVDETANIINKQESTENVSLDYIEAESMIETLEIEQERLYAILKEEVSLENIITLESRLSDIRYELQSYKSKLRYYDNKVAYSTVNLSIQEVEIFTPVTAVKQTVGERMKSGLNKTMYNLSEGFKNFLVWFVVNLPYLIIWAIIITVIVIVIRKSMKKQSSAKNTTPSKSLANYNQPYMGSQNMGIHNSGDQNMGPQNMGPQNIGSQNEDSQNLNH